VFDVHRLFVDLVPGFCFVFDVHRFVGDLVPSFCFLFDVFDSFLCF
jgi:hypothetical protein